ncbi:MAG: sulfotransferase domain-containing protein [Pseudomonadota bacterium]
MKPIFILGLGAQKAGTSWLHSLLSKQSNVNLGFKKEYHIWDYVFSDLGSRFEAPLKSPDTAADAIRRMMQADPAVYTAYFRGLITPEINVSGDITPSYSVIGRDGLEKIHGYLDGAGFDVRVFFLMRDPIERIWSAARMQERNRKRKGNQPTDSYAEKKVLDYLKLPGQVARSDYRSTVENIESVFPKDKVHFAIFEDLFNEASIERISAFLGFKIEGAEFDKRVNASPSASRSAETTRALQDFLAPQYSFCREKFPITWELWKGSP